MSDGATVLTPRDRATATSGPIRYFHADERILPGVRYGRPDQLLTPAYWVMRCNTAGPAEKDFVSRDSSLEEEVGFCLLGGYGIKAEIARAYFNFLREHGTFRADQLMPVSSIGALLSTPLEVEGHRVRYRFPNQRASRIYHAMQRLSGMKIDVKDSVLFRNQLLSIGGIGPKTASWIARNWLNSDEVAILDIHVLRAGWMIKLFDRDCKLPRDYEELERRFIIFANLLQLRASVLDAVMWSDMRRFGSRLFREQFSRAA